MLCKDINFLNKDTCKCKDLEIVSFSGFPSSFTGFDKPHVLILIIRIFGKNIQSYFTISAANDMTLFLAWLHFKTNSLFHLFFYLVLLHLLEMSWQKVSFIVHNHKSLEFFWCLLKLHKKYAIAFSTDIYSIWNMF